MPAELDQVMNCPTLKPSPVRVADTVLDATAPR